MKNITLTILLTLLCACSAHAVECRSTELVKTDLDVASVPVSFERSFKELTEDQATAHTTGAVLAIVHGYFETWPTVTVAPRARDDKDTWHCVVAIAFAKSKIYVAKELKDMPCAVAEVLAHERGHGAIYAAHLQKTFAVFGASMVGASKDIGRKVVQGLFDADIDNAKHDNAAEYERMAKVCAGAIVKTAARQLP